MAVLRIHHGHFLVCHGEELALDLGALQAREHQDLFALLKLTLAVEQSWRAAQRSRREIAGPGQLAGLGMERSGQRVWKQKLTGPDRLGWEEGKEKN